MRQTKRKAAILAMYAPQTREEAERIRLEAVAPPFDVAGVASFLYGFDVRMENPTLYRSVRRTLDTMAKAGQLVRVKVNEGRGPFGHINSQVVRYALPGTCEAIREGEQKDYIEGECSTVPDTGEQQQGHSGGGYSPGYDAGRGIWRL
ncbi:hypothetical protein MKB54_001201 [Salmonella enterica]|nr:hypothetical protein [Salmonella enterica]EKY6697642.1 hypothetical protein [Salmonella enterica]